MTDEPTQSRKVTIILKCPSFKLLFMAMLYFFAYVKLISRQVATWSFIPTPFRQDSSSDEVYTFLQSASPNSLIALIAIYFDASLSYINGWRSFNKQFSNDSFLNW